jgi:phosphatidylglycerol---prolipoprotein diacylglyceryl transferase
VAAQEINLITVDQYAIRIGSLAIHFYALILITGIIAGTWLCARRAKARGKNVDYIWDGLFWAIIPGLIGARLYHVLTPSPASGLSLDYYLRQPLQIFAIWNGGLGIYGAILGGAVGIWLFARVKKEPILPWLDICVPGVALAQAIGRWGNWVNQELYGAATNLPWAIYIPPGKRLPGHEGDEFYHPLFLYESILNLIACFALIWIDRRYRGRLRPGDLLLIYLMMYSAIRFTLDFLRLDSNGFGSITTAQIIGLFLFIGSGAIFVLRRTLKIKKVKNPAPAEN